MMELHVLAEQLSMEVGQKSAGKATYRGKLRAARTNGARPSSATLHYRFGQFCFHYQRAQGSGSRGNAMGAKPPESRAGGNPVPILGSGPPHPHARLLLTPTVPHPSERQSFQRSCHLATMPRAIPTALKSVKLSSALGSCLRNQSLLLAHTQEGKAGTSSTAEVPEKEGNASALVPGTLGGL